MDQRLEKLAKKNSNLRKASTEENFSSSTLNWLGGKGVPMLAAPSAFDQQKTGVIREEHESARTFSRNSQRSRSQKQSLKYQNEDQKSSGKHRSATPNAHPGVQIDAIDQSMEDEDEESEQLDDEEEVF